MVLLRTLVSSPQSLSQLPPTGQVLVSHRHSASGSNSRASSLLGGGEVKCLAEGNIRSSKEFGLQKSQALSNRRVGRNLDRFSTSSTSTARREGGAAQHSRIVCRGTSAASKKGVSVRFFVTLEENSTVDSTAQAASDQIKIDGPVALSLVLKKFDDLVKKTDTVELSLVLCNDSYIQELNSKWRRKDSPTDVLSFPQQPEPGLKPHLLLGDVIISLDTAAKQGAESGHTLLDELRILLVHGILQHVLGYDHERGAQASLEMEAKETQILAELGWKAKDVVAKATDGSPSGPKGVSLATPVKKRPTKPPFKILFCDMDGTLLDENARVTTATADALRAAMARGVQVIIATGKTQFGAMAALTPVGLNGPDGVIGDTLPGVFTQGCQVYGKGGSVVYSAVLDPTVVRQAFLYSRENNVQSVGFCENRSVALTKSKLTEILHSVYVEAEADIIPDLDLLMESSKVQKFLFYDTPKAITKTVRPYWVSKDYRGKVTCVQALDDMLEMLPPGQSKGAGVTMLLDHLGVPLEEVMALGDGENDIEMLKLAGWGVAMANGAEETKAVANVLTGSNLEDGAAQAIHKYILS